MTSDQEEYYTFYCEICEKDILFTKAEAPDRKQFILQHYHQHYREQKKK